MPNATTWITLCAVAVMSVACAKFSPEQCSGLVSLAESIAIDIAAEEISDEAKIQKVLLYTRIGAQLAELGCTFVPIVEDVDG